MHAPELAAATIAAPWVDSVTPFGKPKSREKYEATWLLVIVTVIAQPLLANGPLEGGLFGVTVTLPALVKPLLAASATAAAFAPAPPVQFDLTSCCAPPIAAASVAFCCACC